MNHRTSKIYKVNDAFELNESTPTDLTSIKVRSTSTSSVDVNYPADFRGYPTSAASIDLGVDEEGKSHPCKNLAVACCIVFFVLLLLGCIALLVYFVIMNTGSHTINAQELRTDNGNMRRSWLLFRKIKISVVCIDCYSFPSLADLCTLTGKLIVEGSLRVNETYRPELSDPTSPVYIEKEAAFISAMNATFVSSDMAAYYDGCEVVRFEPGSVRIVFEVYLLSAPDFADTEAEVVLAVQVTIEGAVYSEPFAAFDIIFGSVQIDSVQQISLTTIPSIDSNTPAASTESSFAELETTATPRLSTHSTSESVSSESNMPITVLSKDSSTLRFATSSLPPRTTLIDATTNEETTVSELQTTDSPIATTQLATTAEESTVIATTKLEESTTEMDRRTQTSIVSLSDASLKTATPTNSDITVTSPPITRQPKIHPALPDICGTRPAVADDDVESRIVGGTDAAPGSWPWMGSLRLNRGHQCGAVLIHQEWAITAQHCVSYFDDIVLGDNKLSGAPSSYREVRTTTAFSNSDFNVRTDENDIALVKLSSPVNVTDHVQPVCINTLSSEFNFTNCYITGWGTDDFDMQVPITELQEAPVQLIETAVCSEWYSSYHDPLTDRQLCAGWEDGRSDACSGDSGGPLQCQDDQGIWYLLGIVSFGQECGLERLPGVYTRVSTQLDFLQQVLDTNIKV
ncbi:uncharacterized protein [Diadema antillarum]|uniref:uncharacterized protein n=1 Tax=Diadema antillarum TaxID=105358 RepID=UPI003A8A9193